MNCLPGVLYRWRSCCCRQPLEHLRLPPPLTGSDFTSEQQAFAGSLQENAAYIANALERIKRQRSWPFSVPPDYGV